MDEPHIETPAEPKKKKRGLSFGCCGCLFFMVTTPLACIGAIAVAKWFARLF